MLKVTIQCMQEEQEALYHYIYSEWGPMYVNNLEMREYNPKTLSWGVYFEVKTGAALNNILQGIKYKGFMTEKELRSDVIIEKDEPNHKKYRYSIKCGTSAFTKHWLPQIEKGEIELKNLNYEFYGATDIFEFDILTDRFIKTAEDLNYFSKYSTKFELKED